MKNFVVVCLVALVVLSAAVPVSSQASAEEFSPFTLAGRIGEPKVRAFYLFSTAFGNYTIRHDGMGESYTQAGRRKVFNLRVGPQGRIHRIYFLEHDGDLLLLYEATGSGYLVRMDQQKRKARWVKEVSSNFEPPLIKDEQLIFTDGTVVPLN